MENLSTEQKSCANKNTFDSLLEQGELLARNGRLDRSFSAYSNAFRVGVVPKERIESLVTALLEFQRNKLCKEKKEEKCSPVVNSSQNIFICSLCQCLFLKPVTLSCGHTFCQSCLIEERSFSGQLECTKCGKLVSENMVHSVNLLITNSVQKWFPSEYQNQVDKLVGYTHLSENDAKLAVDCFTKILSVSANDFHCLCWRSDALLQTGQFDLALQDIEQACKLRPTSARTFYRKAAVLANYAKLEGVLSSKHEESVLALLRTSALAPRCERYRREFTESLYQLLSPKFTNSNRTLLVLRSAGTKHAATHQEKTLNESPGKHFHAPADERSASGEVKSDYDEIAFSQCSSSRSGSMSKRRRQRSRSFSNSEEAPRNNVRQYNKKSKGENYTAGVTNEDKLKDLEDFECKLCFNLLFQPITTICGHTFCRECLERCLDHRVECPCCRTALDQYHRGVPNMEVTEVLELILVNYFAVDYNERKRKYLESTEKLASVGKDGNVQVPIFVCTLAVPKVPCPLHIFEPRYRLMLRRCVTSGSKQFGMCIPSDDPNKNFADYGTMLIIKSVNFLPDGRSIVDTVGGERFHVVSRGMLDGYDTATVEWLKDEEVEDTDEIRQLHELNRFGHQTLQTWFSQMASTQQQCIMNAIGPIPALREDNQVCDNGPDWMWWVLAALPLQDKQKLIILGMTSILERLKSVIRFLQLILSLQNKSMETQSLGS